ncbi:MAG TPA: PEGA domain-containing protein [Bacteroidales bacterium]|nr:PEGA domain-containing protein [Bacteroidales bacterium]
MKKLLLIIALIVPYLLNAQTSYIQVEAEAGISVYIDNAFKGKTSTDYGGLIIEDVTPGSRAIKLVKDGFIPQEDKIDVKSGEVYTYKVQPFIPKIKITESGNSGEQEIELKVGTLKIQSLPVSIRIEIPALGVNTTKQKDEWMAEDVPMGIYPATFKYKDKSVKFRIVVEHNAKTHLMVNMLKQSVQDTIYFSNSGNDVSNEKMTAAAGYKSTGNTSPNKILEPTSAYNNASGGFPYIINGIQIGKTTVNEAERLGYIIKNYKKTCHQYADKDGLSFWDFNCNGVLEYIRITSFISMPQALKNIGFDYSLSYKQWIEFLRKKGYTIEILSKPHQEFYKYKGYNCFSAEIRATRSDVKRLDIKFNYSKGNEDSENTIYDITMVAFD